MSSNSPVVLSIEGLSKTFTGQKALRSVDFQVHAGEIRALVGPNGSGKSTLVKILAGYHQPDEGAVATVDGQPFELGHADAAFAAGLRFVHQDLGLVPALGAMDNLALGRGYIRGRSGTISWRRERETGEELLASLGYDFDFRAPVSSLAASERTGIAIARALEGWRGHAKILVLDEPTASLPAAEVNRLFEVVRTVRDNGVAVIYVSHHFNEVFDISDTVTVLRDGAHVATLPTADVDEPRLVELTIGRKLAEPRDAQSATAIADAGTALLQLIGVGGRVVQHLDVEVGPGEIVGVAGVTGYGREEICGLVFGDHQRSGEVLIEGRSVPPERPDLSLRLGMAYVPPERAAKAALLDQTVRQNTTISWLKPFYGPRGLRRADERAETNIWLDRLEVVPRDSEALFQTLSGGNQQKIVLARALRIKPRVLVLDEPTQGVDVGAKAAIHDILRNAAAEGAGVLVASAESEELVQLCDRIIVMNQGRAGRECLAAEVSADELTEYTLRTLAADPA